MNTTRIKTPNTTHLYAIGYGKDKHEGTVEVEANTRTQACAIAKRNGYQPRDCNMIG